MPAPAGARHRTAPLASLALAALILIALFAFAPGGAAAKRAAATTPAETTPAPTAATEAAATHADAKAERVARRRERNAAASSEGALAQTTAPGTGSTSGAQHGRDPAHKAQRVAGRRARKQSASGAAAPAARAGASAQGAAASKTHKTHAEIERERERKAEQRRRERETAPGGRLKESRKQREAREARERRELNAAASGGERAPAAVAAGGVSNTAGGAPTAQAPADAVASSRTGKAARAGRAARARRAAGKAPTGAAGGAATALGLGGVLVPTSAAAPAAGGGHAAHTKRGGSASHRESPLVRTVTQIVGVIPTALWLLIGALALAAAAFGIRSALSGRRARRLERQRKELLEDVGLLQAALLPELPSRLGPVATSAAYRPASGPGAGGDFYDVFALPEGLLAVIVGDVSGHGREALPHTTLLRYTLRAYLEAGLSPREALRAAAPALERQLGGSFATVVLASYDPRARILTYACAGHPHPILTGLDPQAGIVAGSAPPIGAGRPTGSRQTVVSIPGASTACFYTDGVIEARVGGRLYGQGRLARALAALRGAHAEERSPEPAAEALLDRVAAETDRRPDDMAACLLTVPGDAQRPRVLREELVLDAQESNGKRARRFLAAVGLAPEEITATVLRARTVAAEHGSALIEVDRHGQEPRVSVLQDNVAPLRARALARTQEVAL